jgi:hypothetical protein
MTQCLAIVFIGILIVASPVPARPAVRPPNSSALLFSEKYFRSELYFGFAKKDGTEVSDTEWDSFLANEVSPRFPGGFTVLFAIGQFRGDSGTIVREKSRVLVLFYPKKERSLSNIKIDAIRKAYIQLFDQESVLRVDLRESVRVSF